MNANMNLQCIQILFVGSAGEPSRPGRGTGVCGSAGSGGSSGDLDHFIIQKVHIAVSLQNKNLIFIALLIRERVGVKVELYG